ncbi:MAG: tyrosine-type recombinase/integrase [Flavobacteriales bacterium]|nr:tyrosine-type recombinase/integrase [Flavobacteriales bacterium]
MAMQGQKTKSDFLEWDKFQVLVGKLERDGDKKFALLIGIGCYVGLRISDLLGVKWSQVLNLKETSIIEGKTQKSRTITLHPELQEILIRLYSGENLEQPIFLNRYGTKTINVQYVNRRLKVIMHKYGLKGRFSSHFMRKTLGRRIWEQNDCSEKALLLLGQLFNHSSIQTTKIYLGIREQEIQNIYLSI